MCLRHWLTIENVNSDDAWILPPQVDKVTMEGMLNVLSRRIYSSISGSCIGNNKQLPAGYLLRQQTTPFSLTCRRKQSLCWLFRCVGAITRRQRRCIPIAAELWRILPVAAVPRKKLEARKCSKSSVVCWINSLAFVAPWSTNWSLDITDAHSAVNCEVDYGFVPTVIMASLHSRCRHYTQWTIKNVTFYFW